MVILELENTIKIIQYINNAMLASYQRGGEMNKDLRNGELLQLYP